MLSLIKYCANNGFACSFSRKRLPQGNGRLRTMRGWKRQLQGQLLWLGILERRERLAAEERARRASTAAFEDPAAAPKEWKRVYGGRKGSDEVDLSKDFGGLVGGFPGGEVGVKAYNATGEVATRDAPPTLGWGPPVLLLLLIGGAGYVLNPGDPAEELAAVTADTQQLDTHCDRPVLYLLIANAPGSVAQQATKGATTSAATIYNIRRSCGSP